MILKWNFSNVNLVQGFTEVLTVYFSVKPGEGTTEPTERLPSHLGRISNLGRRLWSRPKAAITPWKNVKPGEDKMTGLVESVGPERI